MASPEAEAAYPNDSLVDPPASSWVNEGRRTAFDRGRESAAAGANVVGRDALARLIRVRIESEGFNLYDLVDALLSPSGPLRDEAVVKAEAWDECIAAIDTACMGKHVGMIENPHRAAALLATTNTDEETR